MGYTACISFHNYNFCTKISVWLTLVSVNVSIYLNADKIQVAEIFFFVLNFLSLHNMKSCTEINKFYGVNVNSQQQFFFFCFKLHIYINYYLFISNIPMIQYNKCIYYQIHKLLLTCVCMYFSCFLCFLILIFFVLAVVTFS